MARSFKTVVSVDDQASASSEALRTKVAGEGNARMSMDAGGKITWGSGSASGDVTLYRSAANTLKTDDTLVATTGIVTLATDGAPSTALDNGALAVDTTNDVFYFRSSGAWQEVSGGGASLTVSETPPASPEAGNLWFESDTGNTLVYYTDANTSQWVELGQSVDSSHEFFINMDGGGPTSLYGGTPTLDGGGI